MSGSRLLLAIKDIKSQMGVELLQLRARVRFGLRIRVNVRVGVIMLMVRIRTSVRVGVGSRLLLGLVLFYCFTDRF